MPNRMSWHSKHQFFLTGSLPRLEERIKFHFPSCPIHNLLSFDQFHLLPKILNSMNITLWQTRDVFPTTSSVGNVVCCCHREPLGCGNVVCRNNYCQYGFLCKHNMGYFLHTETKVTPVKECCRDEQM